jgi:hypothetical protein
VKLKGKAGKMRALAAGAFFAGSAGCAAAAQIATDPGDYMALPAGTDLAILYGQIASRDKVYSNGNAAPVAFKLDTEIGLFRYVHYTTIAGYTINPQFIIPFGSVKLKQPVSLSASGVADPLVGGTLWVVNKPQQNEYVGLSAFLSLPIGNYDASRAAVNLGENRWKGIFHAGWITPITGKWVLDLLGEATVFGDNTDYAGARRKQEMQYGVQAHLRYVLSQTSHVALSYYHDFGAESKVAGVSQNDRLNNSSAQLTYANFVAPTVQLQAQYGRGLKTENGPREDQRFNLRVLKVF